MGNFGFLIGIRAAQKTAAKATDGQVTAPRRDVTAIVGGFGLLIVGLLIVAGLLVGWLGVFD